MSDTRARIESLLQQHPVVLFMKGNRTAPRCGFSAATVGVLDDLLPNYFSVDVLEDTEIREGIKSYGDWPTIPQLYVNGELVGGADIVQSMYASGELQQLLGLPEPDRTPPQITVTDAAAAGIREALTEADPGTAIFMSIDARFQTQFRLDSANDRAVRAQDNGITLYMDPGTAQRARGIRIEWIETAQGAGLKIDNPNAPPAVKPLSVLELASRLQAGDITLIDVRPPEERAQAAITQPFRTLDDGIDTVMSLPKDQPLAFLCRSGTRSARAAEHFRSVGYRDVYNVTGGINAWSQEVDPDVPRY